MSGKKKRVVVLGGGLGAMTAAFELTATEELRSRYEVHVYTQGWRLGGKGASGRNREIADRIEEHGLHAFLGFYENAFTLMQRAYDEWIKKPDNPFQSWTDAFKPQRQVSLAESPDENGDWRNGRWKTWNIDVPPLPGVPGEDTPQPSVATYLRLLLEWLRGRVEESSEALSPTPPEPQSERGLVQSLVERALDALHDYGTDEERKGRMPLLDAAHDIAQWLELCPADHTQDHQTGLHSILDDLDAVVAEAKARGHVGDDLRRLVTVLEIGSAAARGIVSDLLAPGSGGFAAIDHQDFKEWLQKHGLGRELAWSAPIRALYDLGFAYVQGRQGRDNARAAAGVALKVMLSLVLRSKGAPLWKMQAGMGDTIFSPLYEILKRQRGVEFHFFHRVRSLGLSDDKNSVARIELSEQVRALGDYEPLFDVRGLPCWPSEPFWERIENGTEIAAKLAKRRLTLESAWCDEHNQSKTLTVGEDFDLVVLGISIAELEHICPELSEASREFAQSIDEIVTVQTHAFQVWLDRELADLGWEDGTTIMTGYAEPFDTWGEMSHLIPREAWPEGHPARAIEYFCSPMRDADSIPPFSDWKFPGREDDRTKALAIDWLSTRIGLIWPAATQVDEPDALDWARLVDLRDQTGQARFDSQFWRPNIDPTERYVLSVPGTGKYRLEAKSTAFDNLYLAGDWTTTSLNAGCAEAAIESGMRCSRAICGSPAKIFEH